MRVSKHVHRLPVTTPTLFPATTTNVYVIENEGNALLIDAGYENQEAAETIIDYLTTLGVARVIGVALTHHHPDHSPGARQLADFYKCPVLCHPTEVPMVEEHISPLKVSDTLDEGDVLRVGSVTLKVLHAPGHTHGHLNFWLEEERLLFTGDNIVAEGTTWIGPPDGDLIDYLATLHRLQEIRPALIAPGHGEVIHNPQEKIEFFIRRRLERERQILDLLAQKPRTVGDLVEEIYHNQVHPAVIWVAERTVLGHLEKLVRENKITQSAERYLLLPS
jgi:glyoxylase-like metal-dependent hydrolase (beta-lactamase superfamily II)